MRFNLLLPGTEIHWRSTALQYSPGNYAVPSINALDAQPWRCSACPSGDSWKWGPRGREGALSRQLAGEHYVAALRSSYCIAPSELQAFTMAQWVNNLPAMQETWIQFLGQEDPLEEEMATHFSILAWKIPWAEEPGRPQSKELQRVEHDWVTKPIRATDVKESKCKLRSPYSRL